MEQLVIIVRKNPDNTENYLGLKGFWVNTKAEAELFTLVDAQRKRRQLRGRRISIRDAQTGREIQS